MPQTKTPRRFALALLAATCLTPVASAQAAPGDRLGPEFQVNTTTADEQQYPAVAMDADGDFVVAWNRCRLEPDGMGYGTVCVDTDIFAQRYNAAGEPLGPEFQVNTVPYRHPGGLSVAMDAEGDVVVVWAQVDTGGLDGVFARRFDAAGAAQGGAFQVNGFTMDTPVFPTVAMDADGDFVVAWENLHCTYIGCLYDVWTRRFDAAGVPGGDEVPVNVETLPSNKRAAVAMDAEGDYVLAWQGNDQTAGGWNFGIYAQRYSAAGEAQGGVFLVNTTTANEQRWPAVAIDADGDFVVAWQSLDQDGDGYGIFARRYDAAGDPEGGELAVNTTTVGSQSFPSVAIDADGEFVVLWNGNGAGDDSGVFARRYDAAGEPRGGEFRVNATATGFQGLGYSGGRIAMDADGDFVAVWHTALEDGRGIFAQRFDGAERVEGDFDGDGKADLLWRNATTGQAIVWLMDGDTRLEAGSIGTVSATWEIAGTGDFNGDGRADILWRNTSTGNTILWQMDGFERTEARSIGTVPLAWTVERLRDTNGDGLSDIVWRNTGTGATVVWRMSGFSRVAAEAIGNVGSDWEPN
jgi:hypothetical protein